VNETTDAVQLYSSWRGRLVAFVSPTILVVIAVAAIATSGVRVFSLVLLLIGVGIAIVAIFDFPVWARFDAHGVTRRTFLRSHTLAWETVAVLERAAGPLRRRGKNGPLIAVIGNRRYLLVDQPESVDEFTAIRSVVAGAVEVGALPPADDTPPTWLYHRKAQPDC
jgi:hypothetical protein